MVNPFFFLLAKQLVADLLCSEALHPWIDGCHATAVERFANVFKSFLPVYGTLHFVPMLLLRTQHFKRE
jgi:hypothetical protein